MDAALAFVPPEGRIRYSAMTSQSLYYMGREDLRHKIRNRPRVERDDLT